MVALDGEARVVFRMADRIRYRTIDEAGSPRRVRVVMHMGFEGFVARWTESCSGCFESGDYGGNAHNYPYDQKAQCYIGAGCEECGYTGKRRGAQWVPFLDVAGAYLAKCDERWARRERLLRFFGRKVVAA